MPLGALPGSTYQEQVQPLSPGDRLLCYSDGFIETRGPDGAVLGYDGFLQRVERLEPLGDQCGESLIAALFEAEDNAPLGPDDPLARDDRTLVLILAG